MTGQRVVRRNGLLNEVRTRRPHALIDMLPVIAPRPAIESAFAHRRKIVGHEIGPEFVPLVDDRPQFPGLGVEVQSVRVAQTRRKDPRRAGRAIDLPDRGAALFSLEPALAGIGIGADGRVEEAAVRAQCKVLGPVMVDRPARKRREHGRLGIDLRLAELIGIGKDRIGRRDIQRAFVPGYAERRRQAGQKIAALVDLSIPVGIAQ